MISNRFFDEVVIQEIYKPVRKLGSLGTVIDLGACTGEFSLWVYNQAVKVYAIEADIEAFNHLKENVRDFLRIFPVNIGIAGENGKRGLSGGTIGAKSISNLGGDTVEIVAKTLASFMAEEKIDKVDCLKIDVESAEKEIFEAKDFPEVADKIRYIIGEHLEPSKLVLETHGFKFEVYEHGQIFKRI